MNPANGQLSKFNWKTFQQFIIYQLLLIILFELQSSFMMSTGVGMSDAAFLAKFMKVLRTSVFFVLVVFKRCPRLLELLMILILALRVDHGADFMRYHGKIETIGALKTYVAAPKMVQGQDYYFPC